MTTAVVDVVVAGLGAMGSAISWRLAERGARVVGFDRFTPPHGRGSSGGRTRILREAYSEGPGYVPVVRTARGEWRRLEALAGTELFRETGGLLLGSPDGPLLRGALASAGEHLVPHELFPPSVPARVDADWARQRGEAGMLEPGAGVLFPDACIGAALEQARTGGAELRFDDPILSWSATRDEVTVRTGRGTLSAHSLVLVSGAWLLELLPPGLLPLTVTRQVVAWFTPEERNRSRAEGLPVFLREDAAGRILYGLPDVGHGLKAALHHPGRVTTPGQVDRTVTHEEIQEIRNLVRALLPWDVWEPAGAEVCLYTSTPDGHFTIDCHPDHANVVLVSACSGHGFKFAPAIGGLVSDALERGPDRGIPSDFRLTRSRPSDAEGGVFRPPPAGAPLRSPPDEKGW